MTEVCVQTDIETQHLLRRLEGNQSRSSDVGHVQSWIDNLTDSEITCRASEASSPTKSIDSDVFLQTTLYSDDLILGAEARHYGHVSIISPRLSPLVTMDTEYEQEEEQQVCDKKNYGDQDPVDLENDFSKKFVHQPSSVDSDERTKEKVKKQLEQLSFDNNNVAMTTNDPPITLPCPLDNRENNDRQLDFATDSVSSWTSSFDKPSSLAAALYTDAEELLYNLGFCENSAVSTTIPSRFFAQPSQAFGIDVEEIHQLMIMEEDDEFFDSYDSNDGSDRFLLRFSESSIDLASYASSDSHSLKHRRVLFKSNRHDVPSIHLSQDEERSPSPTSVTTSNYWNRLETLEELPEPLSRSNSFESDLLTQQAIASFLAASKATLHDVETSENGQRKFSYGSRNDTLTSSQSEGNHLSAQNSLENEHSTSASLHLKRSNSGKSTTSSIITVIDTEDEQNKMKNERSDNTFKPINEMSTAEQSDDECVSAAPRRSVFGSTRSQKLDLSDSVFNTTDFVQELNDNFTHPENTGKQGEMNVSESVFLPNSVMEPCIETHQSVNDSFREFFSRLRKDNLNNENIIINEKPCIQIVVTPPQQTFESDVFELARKDQNDENHAEIEKHKPMKNENQTATTKKKGIIISALNSLFSKYQDSKQSRCNDNLEDKQTNTTSKRKPEDHKADSVTSGRSSSSRNTYFTFFNHQTFSSQCNSATSFFGNAASLDENDLDNEDQDWVFNSSLHSRQSSMISDNTNKMSSPLLPQDKKEEKFMFSSPILPDRGIRYFQEQNVLSDSSVDNQNLFNPTPHGYDADSTSDECSCPVDLPKRKKSHSKKLIKGLSMESSGFDDDQLLVRCPLGKNCTLRHSKNRHKNDKIKKNEIRTNTSSSKMVDNITTLSKMADADGGNSQSSHSSMLMTHDHFDYLVQQFTSLRSEIKEEFSRIKSREEEVEATFQRYFAETKKSIESEYLGWVAKEIQGMKLKLQEKDDEILRLRDIVNEGRGF